ncbi:hypothetical protein V4V36_15430 [Paenibacillus lautus]|uniref:hypothetical protein n=1 Tax=Paenibacillus lautus TaxID=1401 RepID=UPI002FBDFE49
MAFRLQHQPNGFRTFGYRRRRGQSAFRRFHALRGCGGIADIHQGNMRNGSNQQKA